MTLIKSALDIKNVSHLARIALYLLLLTFTVIYQVRNPFFINLEFLIPIYGFLTLALGINFILAFLNFRKPRILDESLKYLLLADVAIVSGLLYFSGLQSSLYLFFYLYLIFLAALNYHVKGAITLAALCSLLFSVVLFFDISITSNTKIFLFLINNASFFVVAFMGGTLSQRLDFLGEEVVVKDKSIKELKNVNQLIVDNIKSSLITLDEKNRIIQYNREAQNMFGSFELGTELTSQFPEISKVLEGTSTVSVFEISRTQNKGTVFYEVLVSKISLDGIHKGSIVLLQDVTERKRQEEKSKTQEKLAAVGQLAAGIAHEIRNPLASMSGSIQLLAKSFENLDDDQKKLIAITLKETDRLNLLISEFLEFVRPQIALEDKVDLSKLMVESIDIVKLNPQLKQPEFDLALQEGLVIQGNRDKLKQVFLNIIINACHAMEKANSPKLKISLQKNKNIELVISDNGSGMDEKIKSKIFEPFFTTKSKGTGLGLALVHKIVELHGATIEVDSVLGQGTVFRIYF